VVAPTIDGVDLDDGSHLAAQQMVRGGPSVLHDAVAVITSDDGAKTLAAMPEAKDFVTNAHAHKKFIGFVAAAKPLFDAAGLGDRIDDGYVDLSARSAAKRFVEACRAVRMWERP
jgi:catalase